MEKHIQKLEELLRVADNALGMFEELIEDGGIPKSMVLDECVELLAKYRQAKDAF